jgi:hypothetical protein
MLRNHFVRDESPPSQMPYAPPPDTLMHSMSSLMDAKLANVHAKIEKNMEMLQRILELLERKFGSDVDHCMFDFDEDL